MREVEHPEHAEDDGETARHQKQQHAEQHAIERGYDDQFKHTSYSTVRLSSLPRPACGERSDGIENHLRVRGTIREPEPVESPPHPNLLPASGAREVTVHRQFGRS